jgi:hypothetical protein
VTAKTYRQCTRTGDRLKRRKGGKFIEMKGNMLGVGLTSGAVPRGSGHTLMLECSCLNAVDKRTPHSELANDLHILK